MDVADTPATWKAMSMFPWNTHSDGTVAFAGDLTQYHRIS